MYGAAPQLDLTPQVDLPPLLDGELQGLCEILALKGEPQAQAIQLLRPPGRVERDQDVSAGLVYVVSHGAG